MKAISAALAMLIILGMPCRASATGGVWCDAGDKNLSFHFKASSSRDGTGGWWGIEGRLETLSGGLPAALAGFAIKEDNLTQRWWDGDDVRLEIQKYQSEPFASVRLTLIAKSVDEGQYRGSYRLDVTNTNGTDSHETGAANCDSD
jgi:hypothetical protein